MRVPTKLLLVSYYAPPASVGAGVAMYHLISNIPKGTFSVLTEQKDPNDLSVRQNQAFNAPYYYYSTKGINPLVQEVVDVKQNSFTVDGEFSRSRFLKRVLTLCRAVPGVRRIGQIVVVGRHILSIVKAGSEAIKQEAPTMIVAYSDSGPVLIASYLLSIKHRIPLSLHFYDLYKGNNLTPALNFWAVIFEPLMLHRAEHIFVMNDLLRDVYRSRSGEDKVTVVYNSLPEHKHKQGCPTKNIVPSIAYLGSIYWAQESALKDLLAAASLVTPQPKITLYTPYPKEYLNSLNIFESDYIEFSTCLPEDSIIKLEEHDLTFLGLSHSSPQQLLINTSSPVRLCDYLNARVPMLIHAPAESFVVKHALAHDFAFVSTEALPEKLAIVLQEALTSHKRDKKVENANQVGRTYHDPVLSADLFYRTITSGSKSPK